MSSSQPICRGHHCDHGLKVNASHSKKELQVDAVIQAIEKVSAIALGIFAASVSWKLFVPYFFLGVSVGIYSYTQDKEQHNPIAAGALCAHGLLEQLTGVKLPAPISLVANLAIMVCHIDHHSTVFVPIVGLSIGAWAGKAACHYGALTSRVFAKL